jgi:hypothetical protein
MASFNTVRLFIGSNSYGVQNAAVRLRLLRDFRALIIYGKDSMFLRHRKCVPATQRHIQEDHQYRHHHHHHHLANPQFGHLFTRSRRTRL